MRIRDWSSDVCSSDLMLVRAAFCLGNGGLSRLLAVGTEKVDGGDLVQALAQAAHIRRRDVLALTQRARLARQLLVVGVTRGVEQSAQLRIAHAAGEPRVEHQPPAPILGRSDTRRVGKEGGSTVS